MSNYVDKPIQSLVERKREQWAREREELARLNNLWNGETTQSRGSLNTRGRNVSKLQSTPEYHRRDLSSSGRRQNLPPLVKNRQTMSTERIIDRELCGGETSGYGSDNTPDNYYQNTNNSNNNWNNHGYESSSNSSREDRLKWNDKGVIVGKYWEPKSEELKTINHDAPGWVKRGLETNAQLEVSNSSPAESPEQDIEKDRPFTGSSISFTKTYIRGQNIHLEPEEIAERERKRQAAIAHQEAIKQQLEERERKRIEEKERLKREEQEEEQRIERDKEIERKRRENEEKQQQEKAEREQKRKEAIRQAMEIAKEEAIREKMKLKLIKQNINEKIDNDKPINNEEIIKNVQEDDKDIDLKNNLFNSSDSNKNCEKINYRSQEDVTQLNSLTSLDSLSLVLQTPLETFQNMQFAVLMPTTTNGTPTAVPIAVPITLQTESNINQRILTPTPYRLKKQLVDNSTQTDNDYNKYDSAKEKLLKDKLNNLEMNYDSSRGRPKERNRFHRDSVDDRPKWGANRPPTRYLKQSEKDPLYQRRKLRQKIRQNVDKRSYSPHSSDESQTASPRSFRKNNNRSSNRPLWRKSDRLFGENMKLYQTELVPLETDKDHIYYKIKTIDCCCRCLCNNNNYKDRNKSIDILKIDHNTPNKELDNYIIDNKNQLPHYNDGTLSDGGEIIQKLNNLHNGLNKQQEHWRNTPTTPSLSTTPRRNSENI